MRRDAGSLPARVLRAAGRPHSSSSESGLPEGERRMRRRWHSRSRARMLRRNRQKRVRRVGISVRRHQEKMQSGFTGRSAILLRGGGATPRVRPERAPAWRGILQVATGRRGPRALLGRSGAAGRRIRFGLSVAPARVQVGCCARRCVMPGGRWSYPESASEESAVTRTAMS